MSKRWSEPVPLMTFVKSTQRNAIQRVKMQEICLFLPEILNILKWNKKYKFDESLASE